VWQKLAQVQQLQFRASSRSGSGWNGLGFGVVEVETIDDSTMLFKEAGGWVNEAGKEFDFSNVYRWSRRDESLKLEHLRFGNQAPVYLFDLMLSGEAELRSDHGHVCSEDLYTATMRVHDVLDLCWRVEGPQMDELIEYRYG